MRVVEGISAYHALKPSVVTTGMFDGVHFGHRKLIEKIIQLSKNQNYESIVLTLWPHPRHAQPGFLFLNTLEEKIELLEQLGVDCLVVERFDSYFSRLSPLEYIEVVLHKTLKAKQIVQGYDHRFGHNREGSLQTLADWSEHFGYQLIEIEPQEIDHIAVSSTKIRQALQSGQFALAKEFLGGAYPISGKVGHGFKMGRKLGFPTANLTCVHPQKLIPPNGVYAARMVLDKTYRALVNVGLRPTFEGSSLSIEAHILDFEGEIYGQDIMIWLESFLREEKKFESVEELKQQIQDDSKQVRQLDQIS
jgi:riboflavin kinase/FMN adenylyltransferase